MSTSLNAVQPSTNPDRAPARALAAAVAAALVAQPSYGFMLGEPQIRSYLGHPLDVRIPVDGSGADAAEASCFSVLPVRDAGVPAISRAQLSIEQQGGRSFLRVRSSEPVNEPAAMLRVQAACNGNGTLVRQFGLLLDPMPASVPSAPIVVAEYANEGAAVATVTPAAAVANVAPAPAARTVGRHSHARTTTRAVHARHGAHKASPRSSASHRGGFLLKLSGAVLDLAPSRGISEAQRVQLREARALLDADDYTSAMLALRDRIDVLQRRMTQLQQQAGVSEAVRAPAVAPNVTASVAAPATATPRVQASPSRMPTAARQLVDASWWWLLVALLGLAALFLPVWRAARRRTSARAAAMMVEDPPYAAKQGVETGRFAPPPAVRSAIAAGKSSSASPELLTDDTEVAIRNARDLYNAGDRLQAAGVLRLAIEAHPERVAPWLPLFDLLMRERLTTEFAELARGFRTLHAQSPAWKTVQRAGQQIDPGNALYREEATAEHQAAA